MITLKDSKETKAIKDHRCSFCNGRIPKGDTYIKSSHVNDGAAYDWKCHPHCNELSHTLNMYESCGNFVTEGDFFDIVSYEYMDIMTAILTKSVTDNFDLIREELDYVAFKHKLGVVYRHHKNKTT